MSPSDPEFRFAQLSDLHLPPMPRVGLRQLAGKRLLGYVSWHKRRKYEHRADVLEALRADLAMQAPEHIAVTGDLTNLGLSEEFHRAERWLRQLGPPDRVTVVPGNHDAYAVDSAAAMRRALGRRLRDDRGGGEFPLLHIRRAIAFIGVSTAVPSGLGQARGRVGQAQLDRLAAQLAATERQGLTRVVLLHHPPQPDAEGARRGLDDAPALRATIAAEGADLILHGHSHTGRYALLKGPHGPVPVYGVASASLAQGRAGQTGHYRLFRPRRGGGFDVSDRRFDAATGRFVDAGSTACAGRRTDDRAHAAVK